MLESRAAFIDLAASIYIRNHRSLVLPQHFAFASRYPLSHRSIRHRLDLSTKAHSCLTLPELVRSSKRLNLTSSTANSSSYRPPLGCNTKRQHKSRHRLTSLRSSVRNGAFPEHNLSVLLSKPSRPPVRCHRAHTTAERQCRFFTQLDQRKQHIDTWIGKKETALGASLASIRRQCAERDR